MLECGNRLWAFLTLMGGLISVILSFINVQVLRLLLDVEERLRRLAPDPPAPNLVSEDDRWVE